MQWDNGFTASYYASVVDTRSWRETNRFEITGGSIKRTDEGLRNSADINCVNYDRNREEWVRVLMNVSQKGSEPQHIALFTGLACSPDKEHSGTLVTSQIKCNSVLKPCEDVLLPRGWYAPSSSNAGEVIQELFEVTPAPVEIEGTTPNLAESIVAEEGENRLTMAEKVLTSIGWRMQIAGDGVIMIRPKAQDNSVVFSPVSYDCIETKVSDSYDWFSAPNVIRAITATKTVVYKDESDSIMSVPNRGREVWMEESNCNLNDGESLESYAIRRLAEEQRVNRSVSYTRRFVPDLYPSDHIELRYPTMDILGSFYIKSQSISIGYGAPVSEEVNGI